MVYCQHEITDKKDPIVTFLKIAVVSLVIVNEPANDLAVWLCVSSLRPSVYGPLDVYMSADLRLTSDSKESSNWNLALEFHEIKQICMRDFDKIGKK